MFLSLVKKKNNIVDIKSIYTELTRTYLDCLNDVLEPDDLLLFKNSTYLISEGYRNSLCLLLDLETEASTSVVRKYEDKLVAILRPVYEKYNLDSFSRSKKQGLLEACIHCIEKSRRLVEEKL